MTASDYCACGRISAGRCSSCSAFICGLHGANPYPGADVKCESCKKERLEAQRVTEAAALLQLSGVAQRREALRIVVSSPSPQSRFGELRAVGIPFARPTVLEEIQRLLAEAPPKVQPIDVWSNFLYHKLTSRRHHCVQKVTTISALQISVMPDYDSVSSLDFLVFSNGAIVAPPRLWVDAYRMGTKPPIGAPSRPPAQRDFNKVQKSRRSGLQAIEQAFARVTAAANEQACEVEPRNREDSKLLTGLLNCCT